MGRKLSQMPSAPDYGIGDFVCNKYALTKVASLSQGRQLATAREIFKGSVSFFCIVRKLRIDPDKLASERRFWERTKHAGTPISGMPDPSNHFVGYQQIFENERDIFTALPPPEVTLRVFLAAASTPDTLALNVQQIKQIAGQLMRGLEYLHSLGLTHGNICPSSVVLSAPIYTNCAVFDEQTGDFDWVDALTDTRVQILFYGDVRDEGVMIGTDQYRSPEIVTQLVVTEKTDHFSLGCLIAEMVLSKPIFPRVEGSADYARDCILMMQHTVGELPDALAADIRVKHPRMFGNDGVVVVDGRVPREVRSHLAFTAKLKDLVSDGDLYDVIYALIRMKATARWDFCQILHIMPLFTERRS